MLDTPHRMVWIVGTEIEYPQREEPTIYVRSIRSRKYGDYFQLVESYRDKDSGTVKKRVLLRLGKHAIGQAALDAWPHEIAEHRDAGRNEQADKLRVKMERLRAIS